MTLSKLNYINVGKHGTFEGSSTSPADIDAIFSDLDTQTPPRLVLYFHGGLVAEEDGMQSAENIHQALGTKQVHVVTFVWETGFWEILTRNLNDIEETGLFKEIRKFIIRKVGEQLGFTIPGGRGFGDITDADVTTELAQPEPLLQYSNTAHVSADPLTPDDLHTMETAIETQLEREINEDSAIMHLLEQEAPATPAFNNEKYAIPPTGAGPNGEAASATTGRGLLTPRIIKGLAVVAIKVIRRMVKKTDHGPYPTIIEEIFREFYVGSLGKFIWDNIKEIPESQTWAGNEGLSGNDRRVGTYFLERLNEFQHNHPDLTVDMIGHSAGSIMVCHLLKNATERAFNHVRVRNIFFLAPACTSDLFYDEIMTKPARFGAFRMYTMADEFEQADFVVKIIYPRSLLYLVAGLFEAEVDTPILGMQRYLLDQKPFSGNTRLEEIRRYLAVDDRVCFSTSKDDALDGFHTLSQRHGDFDNDLPTLKSLAFLIARQ